MANSVVLLSREADTETEEERCSDDEVEEEEVYREEDDEQRSQQDEQVDKESLSDYTIQRGNTERDSILHTHLCALRETVQSLRGPRPSSSATIEDDEDFIPHPLHTIQAIDYNLWVLASAATLQESDVGQRYGLLLAKNARSMPPRPPPKEKKRGVPVPVDSAKVSATKPSRERIVRDKEKPVECSTTPVRDKPVKEKEAPPVCPSPIPTTPTPPTPPPLPTPQSTPSTSVEVRKESNNEDEMLTRKRKALKEEKEEANKKKANTTPKSLVKDKKPKDKGSAKKKNKKKDDEPRYCLCNRISFGDMIGCDNEDCEMEWFHFECIGLKAKPKGKWFCPECRQDSNNSKVPKTTTAKPKEDKKNE